MLQTMLNMFSQGFRMQGPMGSDAGNIGLQFLSPGNPGTGRLPPRGGQPALEPHAEAAGKDNEEPKDGDSGEDSDDEKDVLEKMEGNAAKGVKRRPAASIALKRPAAAASTAAKALKRRPAAHGSLEAKAQQAYDAAYKAKYLSNKHLAQPRRVEHAQRAGQRAKKAVLSGKV